MRHALALALCLLWPASTADGQAGALHFDGSTDGFYVPWSPSLPDQVFTVSAWIKTDTPAPFGGSRMIVSRGEDDATDLLPWNLQLDINTGDLIVQIEASGGGGAVYKTTGAVAGDGSWHHVAATRNSAGRLDFYLDGAAAGFFTNTVPPSTNTQRLTIGVSLQQNGGGPQPPFGFFEGLIDEVAVWDVSLSGPELAAVATSGPAACSGGLVGYWRFDEGAGQIGYDVSPSAHHGTLGMSVAVESSDPSREPSDAPSGGSSAFTDLGNGLAGTHGVPALTGGGWLCGDDPYSLVLSGALENTTVYFVLGAAALDAPFKGGTLIPEPTVVLAIPSGDGIVALSGQWPGGLPPGVMIWFQDWVIDPLGPAGLAASNGVMATTP